MAKSSYRGKRGAREKKNATEEPYGIDIRQGAHALKPFLLERKKNWHKFLKKKTNYSKSI